MDVDVEEIDEAWKEEVGIAYYTEYVQYITFTVRRCPVLSSLAEFSLYSPLFVKFPSHCISCS